MAQQKTEIMIEAVGASIANKTTAAGAVTGLIGWVGQVNWLGVLGVVVAVLGLLVNVYFQMRRDRRETAESVARIRALTERCDP